MAGIELTPTHLVVHIEGMDRFLAMKTHVDVPLEHISAVEMAAEEAHRVWHGLKMGGTNLPGLVTAGRFLQGGEWAFWDVHDPELAIAILLHDEHYAKLVVGVENPEATVERIRAALSARAPG